MSDNLQDTLEAQLIVSMRIYDTLMTILTGQDEQLARKLQDLHAQGKLLFDSPTFTGEFIAEQ